MDHPGKSALARREHLFWVSSPGGVAVRCSTWGSSLANISVHFITAWFGKIEIPVASYFAPVSQLSLRGLCLVLL